MVDHNDGIESASDRSSGWPKQGRSSDILLHSLDVRIPLGAEADEPAEHYEPVDALDPVPPNPRRDRSDRRRVHLVAIPL